MDQQEQVYSKWQKGYLPLTLKCVKENTKAFDYYKSHNWKIEKEEMGSEGLYYIMKYSGPYHEE